MIWLFVAAYGLVAFMIYMILSAQREYYRSWWEASEYWLAALGSALWPLLLVALFFFGIDKLGGALGRRLREEDDGRENE